MTEFPYLFADKMCIQSSRHHVQPPHPVRGKFQKAFWAWFGDVNQERLNTIPASGQRLYTALELALEMTFQLGRQDAILGISVA
jgi:hypothetical protein